VHRNAVVWADGDVLACVAPGTKVTGNLRDPGPFWDLWNGPVMQDIRSAFDTPREWPICKGCWYRASRFQTLRDEAQGGGAQTLVREEALDERMWDFSGPKA
jgi:radical SAM protein with 4Fe4S-binding SPASM domain